MEKIIKSNFIKGKKMKKNTLKRCILKITKNGVLCLVIKAIAGIALAISFSTTVIIVNSHSIVINFIAGLVFAILAWFYYEFIIENGSSTDSTFKQWLKLWFVNKKTKTMLFVSILVLFLSVIIAAFFMPTYDGSEWYSTYVFVAGMLVGFLWCLFIMLMSINIKYDYKRY